MNFQILLQSDEIFFFMLSTARKYCHDYLIYFAIQLCTYHANRFRVVSVPPRLASPREYIVIDTQKLHSRVDILIMELNFCQHALNYFGHIFNACLLPILLHAKNYNLLKYIYLPYLHSMYLQIQDSVIRVVRDILGM